MIHGAGQNSRFELATVCSRHLEMAEIFAAQHNILHLFTSLEEMVCSSFIDAVYIASPNFLHAGQSIFCMRYGKHVLCEKPFASIAAPNSDFAAATAL